MASEVKGLAPLDSLVGGDQRVQQVGGERVLRQIAAGQDLPLPLSLGRRAGGGGGGGLVQAEQQQPQSPGAQETLPLSLGQQLEGRDGRNRARRREVTHTWKESRHRTRLKACSRSQHIIALH